MRTLSLHNWNLSYSQAVALQRELAQKIQLLPLKTKPKTVAGLDCALSKDNQSIIAAVVVLRVPSVAHGLWEPLQRAEFELVETATARQKISFPYIPGLLSFRESPVCLAAVEKLKAEPDAFMIDGQGIAHPRRFGIAAHLGLFFNKPTIGCAKSVLVGSFEEPAPEKGAYSPLKDKQEVIGAAVRTRTNVEPVFVSVGNRCTLEDAIDVTLAWTGKYRLPEPTRLAHQAVGRLKLRA